MGVSARLGSSAAVAAWSQPSPRRCVRRPQTPGRGRRRTHHRGVWGIRRQGAAPPRVARVAAPHPRAWGGWSATGVARPAPRGAGHRVVRGRARQDLVMARLSAALLVRSLRYPSDSADRPGWLSGLHDPSVAAATDLIRQDQPHRGPWPRSAAAAGLSRPAFATRFTDRVGQSAMRYLFSVRMQRPRSMLHDQQATVAAIATRVRYSSDVDFATALPNLTSDRSCWAADPSRGPPRMCR